MHRLYAVLLLAACCGLACLPHPPPGPVPPRLDAGGPTCGAACQHLTTLDCAWARPTANGHTCLEVCQNVQESGIVGWNLPCLQLAPTCQDADRCR